MNVLITGANRGIGLALAQALHARGDRVFAAVRHTSPELDAVAARVIEGIDITDDDAPARLVAELGDTPLDQVVLNAGVLDGDRLGSVEAASVRRQLEVNALAPLMLAQALAPRLGPGAKVALVTSRMGSIADNTSGGYYGYRMSKAALNAGGRSLALDLRPRGIAVVLLHPGFVRTGMTGGQGQISAEESAAGLLARIDETTLAETGRFVHMNGEALPW